MPTTFKTYSNGSYLYPSDLDAIQEDYARLFESYKDVITRSARLDAPGSGGPYLLGEASTGSGVAASGATAGLSVFRFEPAWEEETEPVKRTPKCNLRTSLVANATAPAITFTVGLYKVEAAKGGEAAVELTLAGSPITGSTCAFATPAKETLTEVASGDFSAPAAGFYAIAVAVSGSAAAKSSVAIRSILQVHQV